MSCVSVSRSSKVVNHGRGERWHVANQILCIAERGHNLMEKPRKFSVGFSGFATSDL